jgi:hypothetical protein
VRGELVAQQVQGFGPFAVLGARCFCGTRGGEQVGELGTGLGRERERSVELGEQDEDAS